MSALWQPIATHGGGRSEKAFFWVVPLTAEEAPRNGSGVPITVDFRPHVHMGLYASWSSLSKATHWQPLPEPPK